LQEEKNCKLKTPSLFAWKELASFSAPFSLSSALILLRINKTVHRSTTLQIGKHFPFAPFMNKKVPRCVILARQGERFSQLLLKIKLRNSGIRLSLMVI